jgi:curved DNA-binding protein CbpA
MDIEAIRGWLAVIDQVSYYELLGVDPAAGQDEIRRAFHGFATAFHPDGHGVRPADERAAINRIFTRGTEAYRVLSDSALRSRYDEQRAGPTSRARLSAGPSPGPARTARPPAPPPPPPSSAGVSVAPKAAGPVGRLEDHVKNSRARPFAQQAEALAKKLEYGKAKLQLKLAMNMDPNNPALETYLGELDQRIAEAKRRPV